MEYLQTAKCSSTIEVQDATKGLDKASLCPLKIDNRGVLKDVDNFVGVYNYSRGTYCGNVSKFYKLVQHKEYFDSFAEAFNRLGVKYNMIIKQQGNRAFADIEFIGRNLKFDKLNEEFITGMRLINSYDRSTGLHCAPRFTRLACTNGMILTRAEKAIAIRHNSPLITEIESFVEKRIAEIINKDEELKLWVSNSIADTKEWMYCCKLMERLFPQFKHREEILKRLGISCIEVEDKKTKKKIISYVWDDKTKMKDKFTRWELYNAITAYITHGEHISPHIENLFQSQAEKLLITPMDKFLKIEVTI
jgi:hypothetical protein